MPGWHEATLPFQRDGRIQTVGIIQEQHPDRARLFMQWQQMDWPILVDSLDLLDVSVVPITLLIDEFGVVRQRVSPRDDALAAVTAFLKEEFDPPPGVAPAGQPDVGALVESTGTSAHTPLARGDAMLLWGGVGALDEAIEALAAIERRETTDGRPAFHLGVAQRMRYDSTAGEAGDFVRAVAAWSRALELDPNNYIWRRRLQQYGPRLGKPYPFYDWVETARTEILARGETPVELPVEPRGAELARPSRSFEAASGEQTSPAGEDRIHRDPGRLIEVTTLSVPARLSPGGSARIHLEFRPRPASDAHWNNEMKGLVLRVDPPDGWQVDRRSVELGNPAEPASLETRRIELELQSPAAAAGAVAVPAYALYYVCEGRQGQCLYRRQDISIPLSTTAAAGQ